MFSFLGELVKKAWRGQQSHSFYDNIFMKKKSKTRESFIIFLVLMLSALAIKL